MTSARTHRTEWNLNSLLPDPQQLFSRDHSRMGERPLDSRRA